MWETITRSAWSPQVRDTVAADFCLIDFQIYKIKPIWPSCTCRLFCLFFLSPVHKLRFIKKLIDYNWGLRSYVTISDYIQVRIGLKLNFTCKFHFSNKSNVWNHKNNCIVCNKLYLAWINMQILHVAETGIQYWRRHMKTSDYYKDKSTRVFYC